MRARERVRSDARALATVMLEQCDFADLKVDMEKVRQLLGLSPFRFSSAARFLRRANIVIRVRRGAKA